MTSKLETCAKKLIEAATGNTLRYETPDWLLRPGKLECAGSWPFICEVYRALTGLQLPDDMPEADRRIVDGILVEKDGLRIVEIDGGYHFNRYRRLTLEMYPADVALAYDRRIWISRSGDKAGPTHGKRAVPRPPLFPDEGGRHLQRAFRDVLADLLPPLYGFLPTLRVGYFEEKVYSRAIDPVAAMRQLLAGKGCV